MPLSYLNYSALSKFALRQNKICLEAKSVLNLNLSKIIIMIMKIALKLIPLRINLKMNTEFISSCFQIINV